MTDDDAREAVRLYFEATQSGSTQQWLSRFAPGAVVEDPVGTEPLRDREALERQGDAFLGGFREVGLHPGFVSVAGHRAAASWEGRALTHDGETVSFEGIDTFEFDEDGLITKMMGYWTPPG